MQRHEGCRLVSGPEELAAALKKLFENPEEAEEMKRRAVAAIGTLGGALEITLEALKPYLPAQQALPAAPAEERPDMRLEPPPWWYAERIPLAAWGLLPVSALYGAAVRKRFREAAPYRGKLPVICVGNFTMGGAGKTPVALKLAAMLSGSGLRPGFLTRGYGGRERGPISSTPLRTMPRGWATSRCCWPKRHLSVVSRNRPAGARLLETLAVNAIVMDDGFQNPSLAKDFSLIVIDAAAGLGSGRVFPLGPLRAPLAFQPAWRTRSCSLEARRAAVQV